MQKIFTTLLVVLGTGTAAMAQTAGKTEVGINVGLNEATVTTGDGNTNSNYRTGFNAGVSLDYFFSDRWSIKGKVSYDQKGWNNGFIANGNNVIRTDYKVNYITIPVMANWHFGRTRNWYLNFGPYVGILMNVTETTGGTDLKDAFNSTDIGLALGIGVKIPVAERTKFFIELDGTGGATDLVKNNGGTAIRNSVSQINIGFNF